MPAPLVSFLLAGCGSDDPDTSGSFIIGWILFGLLALFMTVLFVGVVRYLFRGRSKKEAKVDKEPSGEYEFDESDEDEEPVAEPPPKNLE